MRFLEEASKLGELNILLWSDGAVQAVTGKAAQFPLAEREYFIQALRCVAAIHFSQDSLEPDALPELGSFKPGIWVVDEKSGSPNRKAFCESHGIEYRILRDKDYAGFPTPTAIPSSGRKKVIVTGCYDWFHTGHVRFFEEVWSWVTCMLSWATTITSACSKATGIRCSRRTNAVTWQVRYAM